VGDDGRLSTAAVLVARTGKARRKITIQESAQGHDTMGGPTDTWTAVANLTNIWAEKDQRSGQEGFTGEREQATKSVVWTVRYKSAITEQMRVLEVKTSNTYDIVNITNVRDQNAWLEITGVRVAA